MEENAIIARVLLNVPTGVVKPVFELFVAGGLSQSSNEFALHTHAMAMKVPRSTPGTL